MPLSYRRELHLQCDNRNCGKDDGSQLSEQSFDDLDAHPKIATPGRLKQVAKREGWLIVGKQVLCPRCAKSLKDWNEWLLS